MSSYERATIDCPELPNNWAWANLSDISTLTAPIRPVKKRDVMAKGKLPVVDQGQGHITGYTDDEDATIDYGMPVIVFGDHTRKLQVVNFAFAAGAEGVKLIVPAQGISGQWLFWALKATHIPSRGYGRHWAILRRLDVPMPPRAEQDRIVETVETAMGTLDLGTSAVQEGIHLLDGLHLAVLEAAFSGRLVGNVQPNVEQADVPNAWRKARLADVATHCLGKMLDKEKNKGNLRPYLRNINVRWGGFDLSDVKAMRIEDRETERYEVQKGDVLICEGGEPGRAAVWEDDREMYFQKALHRVRPNREELRPEYLAHYMRWTAASPRLSRLFTGSTIKHLPGDKLAEVQIVLPPVSEQDRIVTAIETASSSASRFRDELDALRADTDSLRRSILHQAFTGQLVPQDPEEEPASALLERIKAEKTEREAELKAEKTRARAAKRESAQKRKSSKSSAQDEPAVRLQGESS